MVKGVALHTLSTECVEDLWHWSLPNQKDLLFYLASHLISSYHGNQSARLTLSLCSLSSDSFHPPCPNHKSQPFSISATHSAILFCASLLFPPFCYIISHLSVGFPAGVLLLPQILCHSSTDIDLTFCLSLINPALMFTKLYHHLSYSSIEFWFNEMVYIIFWV